jgi:hypothetical protein
MNSSPFDHAELFATKQRHARSHAQHKYKTKKILKL